MTSFCYVIYRIYDIINPSTNFETIVKRPKSVPGALELPESACATRESLKRVRAACRPLESAQAMREYRECTRAMREPRESARAAHSRLECCRAPASHMLCSRSLSSLARRSGGNPFFLMNSEPFSGIAVCTIPRMSIVFDMPAE